MSKIDFVIYKIIKMESEDIQLKEDAVVYRINYGLPESFCKMLMNPKYKWAGRFPLVLPYNESLMEILMTKGNKMVVAVKNYKTTEEYKCISYDCNVNHKFTEGERVHGYFNISGSFNVSRCTPEIYYKDVTTSIFCDNCVYSESLISVFIRNPFIICAECEQLRKDCTDERGPFLASMHPINDNNICLYIERHYSARQNDDR